MWLYVFNATVVFVDIIFYFINRSRGGISGSEEPRFRERGVR